METESPQPCNRSGKDALSILTLAALLLAGYATLLYATGARAQLAESNLQANLIRISNYLHEPPAPVALVGSSVAGRLLPEYFSENGISIQNVGLDGSRPLFAFEILRMRKSLPAVILVDTSVLFQPLMSNDDTLRESVENPTFQAGKWFPPLRPSFRPSSLLYSRIKSFRDSRGGGVAQPAERATEPENRPVAVGKVAWDPQDQFDAVRSALKNFQTHGADVRLLAIPRGAGWGTSMEGLERRLANELGLPVMEPGPTLAAGGAHLVFSDGLHLDVPSAKRVSGEISRRLHLP